MGPDACGLACRADVVMLDVVQEEPVSNGNSVQAAADKQGMGQFLVYGGQISHNDFSLCCSTMYCFVICATAGLARLLATPNHLRSQHKPDPWHAECPCAMQAVACCSKAAHWLLPAVCRACKALARVPSAIKP